MSKETKNFTKELQDATDLVNKLLTFMNGEAKKKLQVADKEEAKGNSEEAKRMRADVYKNISIHQKKVDQLLNKLTAGVDNSQDKQSTQSDTAQSKPVETGKPMLAADYIRIATNERKTREAQLANKIKENEAQLEMASKFNNMIEKYKKSYRENHNNAINALKTKDESSAKMFANNACDAKKNQEKAEKMWATFLAVKGQEELRETEKQLKKMIEDMINNFLASNKENKDLPEGSMEDYYKTFQTLCGVGQGTTVEIDSADYQKEWNSILAAADRTEVGEVLGDIAGNNSMYDNSVNANDLLDGLKKAMKKNTDEGDN